MIDIRLQIVGAEAVELDENTVELGVAPALVTQLPGMGPLPLQIGVIRMPMSKESAQAVIDSLQQAIGGNDAQEKPVAKKKSDLVVATSMQGVEQAAKMDQKLKQGK